MAAVITGQMVSYRLQVMPRAADAAQQLGVVVLAALFVAFVFFSYQPPHAPPFRDPATGQYGGPQQPQ
jgi:hypothetical protein